MSPVEAEARLRQVYDLAVLLLAITCRPPTPENLNRAVDVLLWRTPRAQVEEWLAEIPLGSAPPSLLDRLVEPRCPARSN